MGLNPRALGEPTRGPVLVVALVTRFAGRSGQASVSQITEDVQQARSPDLAQNDGSGHRSEETHGVRRPAIGRLGNLGSLSRSR